MLASTSLEGFGVWASTLSALVLACLVGVLIGRLVLLRKLERLRQTYNRRETDLRRRNATLLAEKDQQIVDLINSIDDRVERRLEEWFPEPATIDEAFRQAERMAEMRQTRDAGRTYLPRSDSGPQAAVYRAAVRRKPLA